MKKSITFIIIVIMGFGILFAQSNVSNTLKIKNIEEIAREQNPDLFSPKNLS